MPKGKAIPDMMNNEVVEFFYTCLETTSKTSIDFEVVAEKLGLKNAAAASQRFGRMMMAQKKTGPDAKEPLNRNGPKKATSAATQRGAGAKKQKSDDGRDANQAGKEGNASCGAKAAGEGAGENTEVA